MFQLHTSIEQHYYNQLLDKKGGTLDNSESLEGHKTKESTIGANFSSEGDIEDIVSRRNDRTGRK